MKNALTRAQNKLAGQQAAHGETVAEIAVLNQALDKAKAEGREVRPILGAITRANTKLRRQADAIDVTKAEIDIFSSTQEQLQLDTKKGK